MPGGYVGVRIRHLASEDLLACMEDYTATVRIIRRYNHELVQASLPTHEVVVAHLSAVALPPSH